jgi:hypothetical protein
VARPKRRSLDPQPTAKRKSTTRASKPRKPAVKPAARPTTGAKMKPATKARPATRAKPAVKAKPAARVKPRTEAKRTPAKAPSRFNDERTHTLADWRAEALAEVRRLIHEADPRIVEERKWAKPTNPLGVPVWSHAGIVCTGEVYKQIVKLTFARGASLEDPEGLFNSSLEGNTRRAIDIREGEALAAEAFRALIRAAVAENLRSKERKGEKSPVVLLSGGNPQIAKAEGDAPVQAYIAAMPGWKRDVGKRLDALIVRNVPNVPKAVKWNTPFYGIEGQGWFLGFHVFSRYVKVTFFRGTSLRPIPPGGTPKSGDSRWIDVHEDDLDEAQMAAWVKQAAVLPGWAP